MPRNNRFTTKSHRRDQRSKRHQSPWPGQLAYVFTMNPRPDERERGSARADFIVVLTCVLGIIAFALGLTIGTWF
jgi:hypothetical protein